MPAKLVTPVTSSELLISVAPPTESVLLNVVAPTTSAVVDTLSVPITPVLPVVTAPYSHLSVNTIFSRPRTTILLPEL